jgi:leucine dehydrogenase
MNFNSTELFQSMSEMGHEQVLFCRDVDSGYSGIIAIHSTRLGPAVGGTRFWSYASEEDALIDALRLSRGMTYKCAIAGVPLGGAKSIILRNENIIDREKLFRAHGRFVERLGGRYITAEDVGTTPADMEMIALETSYVGGLEGKGGDPSPWTALGVYRAMQASAKHRWGSDDLRRRRVALQGCGNVGHNLARELYSAGARLIVSDVDEGKVKLLVNELDAIGVEPDEIYSADADIFAPCALGGVINDLTIPKLKAKIVCGGANNQLLEPRHGDALDDQGIVYAPDYVANGGGVLSGGADLFGWTPEKVRTKVLAIYDTVRLVFELSGAEAIPSYRAADKLAEHRLREGPANLMRNEDERFTVGSDS